MMRWDHDSRHVPHREHSRFVSAGGLKWHVQLMGAADAPVCLLIHGTGASTHSFAALAPLLAEHFRVVIPDLPGHGFTGALRDPTPPRVAASVGLLLAELGTLPDLTVGHSVGAAIAFTMAASDLARPRAIVALGGALLPFPGMSAKLFPGLAKLLFVNPFMPAFFSATTRFQSMPDLMLRWTGSRLTPPQIAHYERLFRDSTHTGGALALMANWDLHAIERTIPQIDLPVLLAHGERDKTVPPDTSRQVAARLAKAELVGLPGLGHLAHEEAPERHAQLIRDFAARHGIAG